MSDQKVLIFFNLDVKLLFFKCVIKIKLISKERIFYNKAQSGA